MIFVRNKRYYSNFISYDEKGRQRQFLKTIVLRYKSELLSQPDRNVGEAITESASQVIQTPRSLPRRQIDFLTFIIFHDTAKAFGFYVISFSAVTVTLLPSS